MVRSSGEFRPRPLLPKRPSVSQTSPVVAVEVEVDVLVDVLVEVLVLELELLPLELELELLELEELVEGEVSVPVLPVVPWSHEWEFFRGPPYGGGCPLWPSASHGGLVGGGFGVPFPPFPKARPGMMNRAVAKMAIRTVRICLLLICLLAPGT
jgi:hypothetical protein